MRALGMVRLGGIEGPCFPTETRQTENLPPLLPVSPPEIRFRLMHIFADGLAVILRQVTAVELRAMRSDEVVSVGVMSGLLVRRSRHLLNAPRPHSQDDAVLQVC